MRDTLNIDIEDLSDRHECPECGKEFDDSAWENEGGYCYPRSGGVSRYGCPENECEGRVNVYT